jgi:hypothetical protein
MSNTSSLIWLPKYYFVNSTSQISLCSIIQASATFGLLDLNIHLSSLYTNKSNQLKISQHGQDFNIKYPPDQHTEYQRSYSSFKSALNREHLISLKLVHRCSAPSLKNYVCGSDTNNRGRKSVMDTAFLPRKSGSFNILKRQYGQGKPKRTNPGM